MEKRELTIGGTVEHTMGHRGTVVAFDGPHQFRALVQFVNTTSWVWVSDLSW